MSATSSKDSKRPSNPAPSASSYLKTQMEMLAERPDETVLWSDLTDGLRNLTQSIRRRFETPVRAAH